MLDSEPCKHDRVRGTSEVTTRRHRFKCSSDAVFCTTQRAGDPGMGGSIAWPGKRPVRWAPVELPDVTGAHSRCRRPQNGGADGGDGPSGWRKVLRNVLRMVGRDRSIAAVDGFERASCTYATPANHADAAIEEDPSDVIRISDVELEYTRKATAGHLAVLRGLNLAVRKGEIVAVVGRSGSGKTTILQLVAGLVEPTRGSVSVLGEPAQAGDPKVGYMFARDALLPWRTAFQNVTLPLEIAGRIRGGGRDRARALLEKVGVGHAGEQYPAELSQGMRQRVALARTLVTEPDVLLMDEPFSALDAQTRVLVQAGFLELAWESRGQLAILLVTHDLGEAVLMADRVVMLGGSPGTVQREWLVPIPRPRSVLDIEMNSDYVRIHRELWQALLTKAER